MSMIGFDEALKVTSRQDIYPTVDPKIHYDAQTFANKVVLITGASRGIGAQIALQYARAGASLSLVARTQDALNASKDAILREHPSAKMLTFPADVRDVKRAAEVVTATVDHFGCSNILIASAGILRPMDKRALCHPLRIITVVFVSDSTRAAFEAFALKDPSGCFAIPELLKTKGQVVVFASGAGQIRCPNASEYCTSKHSILRFVEFIKLEYPDIKIFAVDPGSVPTDMFDTFAGVIPPDSTAELAASTIQYVTSGKADYLSGRFVSSTWDLGEVDRDWKEKIVTQNSLVSKLSLPA